MPTRTLVALIAACSVLSACSTKAAMFPYSSAPGPVLLSSSSATISCASTASFTASELNYKGSFTASNPNPTSLAITQTAPDAFTASYGPAPMSGTTIVTITGATGQTATISVRVTLCVCVRHFGSRVQKH